MYSSASAYVLLWSAIALTEVVLVLFLYQLLNTRLFIRRIELNGVPVSELVTFALLSIVAISYMYYCLFEMYFSDFVMIQTIPKETIHISIN